MKFHGDINLQDNEMQQMVFQTEVNFPEVPTVGRIVFKDKRVYICIEIVAGIPSWVPLTHELDTYIHVQSAASTTWNVEHNLSTTTPLIQVYDPEHKMVIPGDITIVDNNNLTIDLGVAMAGRAILMMGNVDGVQRSEFAFEHTQTAPTDTWVIDHGLGYYPITRVFIGNEEVQPLSVVHDTIFQTTITFSTAQTGVARLV
jgi:hypothetical protein